MKKPKQIAAERSQKDNEIQNEGLSDGVPPVGTSDGVSAKGPRLTGNRINKASSTHSENKGIRIAVDADFVYLEFKRSCLKVAEM